MGLEHVGDKIRERGEKVGSKAKQNKPLQRIKSMVLCERMRKSFLDATEKEKEERRQNGRSNPVATEKQPHGCHHKTSSP